MSNKSRGSQYELEAQRYLESEGWTVFRVHRKAMMFKDKKTGKMRLLTVGADIFGCDLVARVPGYTRWIQVSVDGRLSQKSAQVLSFPWRQDDHLEVWLRAKGKKEFRRYVYQGNNEFQEYDRVVLKATTKSAKLEEEKLCENQGC